MTQQTGKKAEHLTHDTTLPLKHGSFAASSEISSFTTLTGEAGRERERIRTCPAHTHPSCLFSHTQSTLTLIFNSSSTHTHTHTHMYTPRPTDPRLPLLPPLGGLINQFYHTTTSLSHRTAHGSLGVSYHVPLCGCGCMLFVEFYPSITCVWEYHRSCPYL